MSSKVLKESQGEIGPVVWRRYTFSPALAGKPNAGAADPEAAQLRIRNAELEAAIETQSRQSYEAGVRDGEESARQKLESGIRETVQQLAATIAELAGLRMETIRRAEADTVRLSIEIARRVLHRELSVDSFRPRSPRQGGHGKAQGAGSVPRSHPSRPGEDGARVPRSDAPRPSRRGGGRSGAAHRRSRL